VRFDDGAGSVEEVYGSDMHFVEGSPIKPRRPHIVKPTINSDSDSDGDGDGGDDTEKLDGDEYSRNIVRWSSGKKKTKGSSRSSKEHKRSRVRTNSDEDSSSSSDGDSDGDGNPHHYNYLDLESGCVL
jgi:hypothetical protein